MSYANITKQTRFPMNKPTYKHPFYKPETMSIGVQHNEEYPATTHIIVPTKYKPQEKLYTLEEVMKIQKRAMFLQQRKSEERAEGEFRRNKLKQSRLLKEHQAKAKSDDNDYVKHCQGKGCNVKLLSITTDDKSKYCRKCFLRMHDRDVCVRCEASKKKNEFRICYKCNCELQKLIE